MGQRKFDIILLSMRSFTDFLISSYTPQIISNNNALDLGNITFEGKDWGYLAALFIMLIIIRFVLVFAFYPITTHLGIGSKSVVFLDVNPSLKALLFLHAVLLSAYF